ncbi:TPA: hypothetical protein N0F65_000437 [Lagenidium giganteum]|uniref:PH domain-containing protein n=1 Tax=Lagenidium giganteum TaxID=4803 RepID=A0AAV2YJU0_9STRA|nr:TPA: hypothetical protein N0F65_000437 [Lagenidium giganteum]
MNAEAKQFTLISDVGTDQPQNPSSSNSPNSSCGECETFVNASIQLLQQQNLARTKTRQLWQTVQRLRLDCQMAESAVQTLHKELVALIKCLSVEDLDTDKQKKSGYLTLVQSPTSALTRGSLSMPLFGMPDVKPQVMFCTLHDDVGQLEMNPMGEMITTMETTAPAVQEVSVPTSNNSPPSSLRITSFSKINITTSLTKFLSESLQPSTKEPQTISLRNCMVQECADNTPDRQRFELLSLPNADKQMPEASGDAKCGFVFEVHGGREDLEGWTNALEEICSHKLKKLQQSLSSATDSNLYRSVLWTNLPVTIPLMWLRRHTNQLERSSSMSPRRTARGVTMMQVIKDLERDRIVIDSDDTAAGSTTGADAIDEIVRCLMKRLMEFSKAQMSSKAANVNNRRPVSPASRLVRSQEAKALSFVERVLRGCSRTQSGGDIYDTINLLCSNGKTTICPMSQDAQPVELKAVADATCRTFDVKATVRMQFKVVELPDHADETKSHSDVHHWAILEGILTRTFSFGRSVDPGVVTLHFVPEL